MDRADEQHRAHYRHRDETDAAAGINPELAENPLADDGADESEEDVGEDAVAASMHQLAGQPTGDQAGDNDSKHTALLSGASDGLQLSIEETKGESGANRTRAASLLLFHLAAATLEFAGAALGNDYLRAAFAADVNFAELISHVFERSWHCRLNRTARPSRLRTFYFKHCYDRAPSG